MREKERKKERGIENESMCVRVMEGGSRKREKGREEDNKEKNVCVCVCVCVVLEVEW